MFNKLLSFVFLLSLLFISFPVISSAQDTTDVDEEWEWDDDWDDDWQFEFDEFDFEWDGKPTITVKYGLSQINRDGLNENFTDPGLIEAKLGYITEKDYWGSSIIVKHNFSSFHIAHFAPSISGNENQINKFDSKLWRFGLNWSKGYGYKLGSAAIIPYTASSLDWSRLEMNRPTQEIFYSPLFFETIDDYNEHFRFGTSGEAGLLIRFIPNLGIDASYQRSVIFERHLFWKWLGSVVIEGAGQVLLDEFIEEVLDSSPAAAPVVNVVLKGALLYAIYELRQGKMNWPFDSASPLAYDQFKFGLTFIF